MTREPMAAHTTADDRAAGTSAEARSVPGTGDRRAALIDAAADIVRADGFGAATVKAVTARAGMSIGLLYRYASNIDELLAAVFRRFAAAEFAAVEAAVGAAPHDAALRLSALVEVFASRALRGRTLAWALVAEPVGAAVDAERLRYRARYASLVADIVTAGIDAGALPFQDARITAAAVVGAIGEALTGPLSPVGADPDPQPIIDAIRRLCLRAVGADAAAPAPRRPPPTHPAPQHAAPQHAAPGHPPPTERRSNEHA